MELSYWEYKSWLSDIDFTIVGSGIVGLCCALHLRERFPGARILILEKGTLPQGASTRNAGFACFGSISEILSDLETQPEEDVLRLVQRRWDGIQLLCRIVGKKAMNFKVQGGHEIFPLAHRQRYEHCLERMEAINELLHPVFRGPAFRRQPNSFGFREVMDHGISNPREAQIDTGMMMIELLRKARDKGIEILNGVAVREFEQARGSVYVQTGGFEFSTRHLIIATNGFASELIREDVVPARAQVLITAPLDTLPFKGCFHMDRGYCYFRNIDRRILIGGGRNLDVIGEQTMDPGVTQQIQDYLEDILRRIVLPDKTFVTERRWSGVMGLGPDKQPLVKRLSDQVYCGVRLGGMGIAIGSLIGKELASCVESGKI